MSAWTYFIQAAEGGPIKIGFTSQEPAKRLANLMTGSPVKLRIIALINSNVESALHARFHADRTHGEWFRASEALVAYIRENAECLVDPKDKYLKFQGKPIRMRPPRVGRSHFDLIIPNDNELWDNLLGACDWNDGSGFGDEDVPEDDNGDEDDNDDEDVPDDEDYMDGAPSTQVYEMATLIQGETFFEEVGIDEDAGHVCFLCGACNSRRRFEMLRDLGKLAYEVDLATGAWAFVALFWDGPKQVGVSLLTLFLYRTEGNHHLFDPQLVLGGQQNHHTGDAT